MSKKVHVNLGSDRVLNADNTDTSKVGDNSFFVVPVRLDISVFLIRRCTV